MAAASIVALAGGTGDLGGRIAAALAKRGATLRLLVRPGERRATTLRALGEIVEADPADRAAMTLACAGAACVVSALNGLEDAIVERQSVLLDAAVAAGVPRFIPSDYSLDFTRTDPGENRNLDLRRTFMTSVDAAPIRATSVLNGAFADMLGAEMPIIQPRLRRVLHWGDADQLLDFTTKDDVAAFTAAAAMDADTPRILRVAGDTISARGIADAMTAATGHRFRTLRVGSVAGLRRLAHLGRRLTPGGSVFPAWQGMQYMYDMMSGQGRLRPLDNDRYPDLRPTTVPELLARRF